MTTICKNELKIKPMTEQDMYLAIDRLTRFKSPEEKYNRVFREIISKYLITPKISFKHYEELKPEEIKNIIETIFENSLNSSISSMPCILYKKLTELDKTIYIIDEKTKILMETKIPYEQIIALNHHLDSKSHFEAAKNLQFLNKLLEYPNLSDVEIRTKFKTRFPIKKVILVEGITEEILLPKFAEILGYNFDEFGIEVIAAGGKNQVAKEYLKYRQQLKLPVIILLDADANIIAENISSKLRKQDKLLLIQSGEFEDILPLPLIKKAINYKHKNIFQVKDEDFSSEFTMVKNLEEIYRINGLGEFKKAEFAHDVTIILELNKETPFSDEINRIMNTIKEN